MNIKKKSFFNLHGWIGLNLSLLFFVVCFSGTLATLSHEMDWLFIPDSRAIPSAQKASRNLIVSNLKEAYPEGELEYWVTPDEPYLCNILYVREDGARFFVFANPYTGQIQGSATLTFQRFFRDLHYYLFIPFQVGHFTVLIFAFLLLISLVTALVFFKKWYAKFFTLTNWSNRLMLYRNLHRLGGLWALPFVLLFSLTGVWYFAERTNLFDISTVGNPAAPKIVAESAEKDPGFALQVDYDRAVRMAREQIPGLDVRDISPPSHAGQPIYLTGKNEVPLVRNRANRVYIDPVNYEILSVQRADAIPVKMWLNDIMDPLHFGNWGGLWTKILWFLFGAIISGLVFSGIWIYQKRTLKKNGGGMGIWRYINWFILATVLGFMYYMLVTTYNASPRALSAITAGWLLFFVIIYYLFEIRLPRLSKVSRPAPRKKREPVSQI